MEPRVVAIVVAGLDNDELALTTEAISRQTRPVDDVIIARATRKVPFGLAVSRALSSPLSPDSLIWLLQQDSRPDTGALAALKAALEVSPSVAIAGPKVMSAERPAYIHEFGLTMSPSGRTISLVHDELDQQQHDARSDVLAVGRNGILIRYSVFMELGGFDPGLPEVDDALDLCVRARLAGHRVTVVPGARVYERAEHRRTDTWRRDGAPRHVRGAQLYRRLAYSRGLTTFLAWLGLLPDALARVVVLLVAKRPTAIGGELAASLALFFAPAAALRAKAEIRRTRVASWSALDPLVMRSADVRRLDAMARESLREQYHGSVTPIHFLASGGAWTLLVLAVVSLVVMASLLGTAFIGGGGLLPLSNSVGELWSQAMYGWRDGAIATLGPADPFAFLLAVLGTLTWWNPSFSLVLLWFIAIPAAGLGAWMFASRLTQRPVIRAFLGIGYALAPTLLAGLGAGQPGAVVAHVLLPWLGFAAIRATRSWSASAAASLLFAAIIAAAPSLTPALLILWIGAIAMTGRYVVRYLAIPVPAAVMFAPLIVTSVLSGNPLGVLADPGPPVPRAPLAAWQVVLGFPTTDLAGWQSVQSLVPAPWNLALVLLLFIVLGVLAFLALIGLFSPTPIRAQLALLVALLGFASAVAANNLSVAFSGSTAVRIWAGAGISIGWFALLVGASTGITVLRRFAIYPAIAGLIAVVILAIPGGTALFLGATNVHPTDGTTLPAYVLARASGDRALGTLILSAQPDGGLSVSLERGFGPTLDNSSTTINTVVRASDTDRQLAELAANLASISDNDSRQALRDFGIGSIVLTPMNPNSVPAPTAAQFDMNARTSVALDANPQLDAVGDTTFGLLWRFSAPDTTASAELTPSSATQPWRTGIFVLQLLVLLGALLVAIPSGVPQPAVRPRTELDGLSREPDEFEPIDPLATTATGADDD